MMEMPLENTGYSAKPWSNGMVTLFRRETKRWWKTKRWFIQVVLWTVILDGLLVFALFVLPSMAKSDGVSITQAGVLEAGIQMFYSVATIGFSIAAIIFLQDAVVEEKISGTAEWVLSKPVSRSAFLLSKLGAALIHMVLTMLIVPGIIGFFLFRAFDPAAVSLASYLAGVGVVLLHLLFYSTLTLLLGVLFSSRPPVLGIALGSLFGGFLIPLEEVVQFTPWKLGNIALLIAADKPLPTAAPTMLISTALWALLFLALALPLFQRSDL